MPRARMGMPPHLERLQRKLSDKSRRTRRDKLIKDSAGHMLQFMQEEFFNILSSTSINVEFAFFGDSIASGSLLRSLAKSSEEQAKVSSFRIRSSARHFDFVDTGEYDGSNPPSVDRIKKWIQDRLGIPTGTPGNSVIELPNRPPITYKALVYLMRSKVIERLQEGYYVPANLRKKLLRVVTDGKGRLVVNHIRDSYLMDVVMEPTTRK